MIREWSVDPRHQRFGRTRPDAASEGEAGAEQQKYDREHGDDRALEAC
jgi:hypothetical protein